MGCDGIWESKKIEEIIVDIKKGIVLHNYDCSKIKDIISKLLDDSIAKSTESKVGTDNMSAIFIRLIYKKEPVNYTVEPKF
mmetsp:Transcript_45397/g.69501  ORF Transcript_45397/g.69501 Transcript_45397/m.69501 type:complete len:81 (+) Transcript_45397:325-567(+)